jgi:hypothetical protein
MILRNDWQWKLARELVERFDILAFCLLPRMLSVRADYVLRSLQLLTSKMSALRNSKSESKRAASGGPLFGTQL